MDSFKKKKKEYEEVTTTDRGQGVSGREGNTSRVLVIWMFML